MSFQLTVSAPSRQDRNASVSSFSSGVYARVLHAGGPVPGRVRTSARYVFFRTISNTSLTLATSSSRVKGFGKV
jgi:hypothetical protein